MVNRSDSMGISRDEFDKIRAVVERCSNIIDVNKNGDIGWLHGQIDGLRMELETLGVIGGGDE